PLISNEQRQKVLSFVENAKREGAQLLYGGKIPDAPELKRGFFFEPTIFCEVLPKMQIFKEEVFGPVVCLGKFSHLEEAIELANAVDYALAGCIWGRDEAKIKEIARRINAGIIWVNTYGMFFNELPYGGFKQSGFGKELGREGFLEYTRLKNVIFNSLNQKPPVYYWYGF
ncbi:MAG: aldehyde dehydrogenase family protein, partial [Candidatus Omnitrophica bacterium]|nr:aldehyde dehydrogenase family protein [Candidatus Omnitrophota bacterium]